MKPVFTKTLLRNNEAYQAKSIERTIEKAITEKTPIEETVPMIYTEEKEGVHQEYDIRTDRWDIAQEAADKIDKILLAKREEKPEVQEPKTE